MDFRFRKDRLLDLYTKGKGRERYPSAVVDAFFRRMAVIKAAADERDLRRLKGVHFEKLKTGKGRYSLRLDIQYRLEFTFEETGKGRKMVCIEDITKHYGD